MESDLETRERTPAVFVERLDLYFIVVVLGVAILGFACVLGYSFRHFAMLKQNAEEVRRSIASRTNSADRLGGRNQSTDHQKRSYAHTVPIKPPFSSIPRE
ncbi:hypothetical protein MRX96_016985 [Rhipicephalus microplus]